MPHPIVDLAIDPLDAAHVVASTEHGIYASRDGGATWQERSASPPALLAWRGDTLFRVAGSGEVAASSDAGRTWKTTAELEAAPAAFAAGEDMLYLALHDGRVLESRDGAAWTTRLGGG